MANLVLMPQLGISEDTALISQWHVSIGDEIKTGQKLFTLETGKASYDYESELDGFVLKLLYAEGDEVSIKAPVCVIGEKNEEISLDSLGVSGETASEYVRNSESIKEQVKEELPSHTTAHLKSIDGFVAASPRARTLADKSLVNINEVVPSGPEGRIIERDVNLFLDSRHHIRNIKSDSNEVISDIPKRKSIEREAADNFTDKPLSRIRKIIAHAMTESLSKSAQLTLNASFDATALLLFRKSAKSGVIHGYDKLSINDMILFAVSRIVLEHDDVNAHFTDEKIRNFKDVHLGFACDTERGLVVPVIHHAQRYNLLEMSAHAKRLASSAQAGNILPEEMQGGTFTVTNLGALGVASFTPIIYPPQTAILGVCSIETKVKIMNGTPHYYDAMGLSLTFDHRALDGAPAARFLKALCERLENFPLLLA